MRIKITEKQAKRLNLINEDTDVVAQFEQLCNSKIQEINNIYSKLSNMSVIEIMNGYVKLNELYKYINKIEDIIMDAEKKTYQYINQNPEMEALDIDMKIDAAYSKFSNKVSSIGIIIDTLGTLKDKADEHDLVKSFSDIKNIEI
jgi:hypothetical protein